MVLQDDSLPNDVEVNRIKADVMNRREKAILSKSDEIENSLEPNTLKAVQQAKETGASSWLNVIPLEEHNFTLNKGEFRDALSIRYSKNLRGLPSKCPCGQNCNINRALNCKRGGFVIIRHNNVRDFEANLLRKAFTGVETEPEL